MRLPNLLLGLILLTFSPQVFAATETITIVEDSYVRETAPHINYGQETSLISDGVAQDLYLGNYGEVVALLKWDLSSIPPEATITNVSIISHFFDASSGPYYYHSQNSVWAENIVTWNFLNQGGKHIRHC